MKLSILSVISMRSENGETKKDIKETVDFSLMLQSKFDVYPQLFIAMPLIGTHMYEICLKRGYLTREVEPYVLSVLDEGIIQTEEFTTQDVKDYFIYARKKRTKIAIANLIKFSLNHPKMFAKLTMLLFSLSPRILASNTRKRDIYIKLKDVLIYKNSALSDSRRVHRFNSIT